MKHVYEQHTDCRTISCLICDGGLAYCVVCRAAECELTTDCAGVKLTQEQRQAISNDQLDFRNGAWHGQ